MEVLVGSSGLLEVSMDNNEAIGGFQFALDISPSIASISQITTTDRTGLQFLLQMVSLLVLV